MSISGVDWLLIALVPLVALVLSFAIQRRPPTNYIDYFLARRTMNVGRFLAAFVGSNLVFTAIFLVISFEAARRGWWALAVPISFFLGVVLLVFLYPKLNNYFRQDQTLHQALSATFDEQREKWTSIRRWAAIWTIAAFMGMVGIEYYGAIILLRWSGVSLLANFTLAISLAIICTAFTIRGGLRGIAIVDYWLDGYSVIGILLLFVAVATNLNWSSAFASMVPPATGYTPPDLSDNLTFCFAALVLFVPMPICALDTWQRGVAWKERERVGGVLLLGALGIVVAAAVAMLCGFYANQHGWTPTGIVPLQLTLESLRLPTIAIGLVIGAFIAAVLSTADELLNCCSYALLLDVLRLSRDVDERTSRAYIRTAKFYTGIFGVGSAAIAIVCTWTQRISDIFNVVAATQVVFLLPLLVALFRPSVGKRYRVGAIASMALAFVAAVLCVSVGLFLGGSDGQAMIEGAPIVSFLVAMGVMGMAFVVVTTQAQIKKLRKSREAV